MKTVLIFAHECAPHQRPQSTIGAQRPAQFAKYLADFGWRAIVLCADNTRRREPNHQAALAASRDETRRALAASDPTGPLIIPLPALSYNGLTDRTWRATFDDAARPRPQKLAVLSRKLLTAAKIRLGDWSQNWQPCARAAAEVVAETIKVDACLGEHGPDAGLFLAAWFHARYGTPWLADFRDPMPQGFIGAARRWYTAQGRKLTATAAGTINVTPYWAELDQAMFGRPAWCIPNGFDPVEFPPTHANSFSETADKTQSATANQYFTIIYAGNIISSQRLDIFLQGLQTARKRLGAEGAKLRFVYRGQMHAEVAALAQKLCVQDLTDSAGPVPRASSLAHLTQAQVLLLLSIAHPEQEDVYFRRGYYPAKTFEYFGAQRPILCVPGDGDLLDELLRTTRAGTVAQTPADVTDYLLSTFADWVKRIPSRFQPDAAAIAQYTRRNLTGRLADLLNLLSTK